MSNLTDSDKERIYSLWETTSLNQLEIATKIGTTSQTVAYHLKNKGHTELKKGVQQLEGKIFSKLSVISKNVERSKKEKRSYWNCVCVCGVEKIIKGNKLLSGRTKSCGRCLTLGVPNLKNRKENTTERSLISAYKARAKRKGLPFLLTFQDCMNFFEGDCFYCKKLPSNERKNRHVIEYENVFVYNGIDRLDNNKGYTLENCVSCCKNCNLAKGTMGLEEFSTWIKSVFGNISNWGEK